MNLLDIAEKMRLYFFVLYEHPLFELNQSNASKIFYNYN